MKKAIKLNEQQLRNMVAESVKRVLKESEINPFANDEKYADGYPEMTYDDAYEYGHKVKNVTMNFLRSLTHSGFSSEDKGLFKELVNVANNFLASVDSVIEKCTRYS